MKPAEWAIIKSRPASTLSDEESKIVDLLIAGKSTVEIGKILGQHRSMVWRKLQKIRKRLDG